MFPITFSPDGQRFVVASYEESYDVYIGRGSRLGNKYRISETRTRLEAIDLYRGDFEWRLENEPGFRKYVESLAGSVFGCFCKPAPCHGDVVAEYLNRLKE